MRIRYFTPLQVTDTDQCLCNCSIFEPQENPLVIGTQSKPDLKYM